MNSRCFLAGSCLAWAAFPLLNFSALAQDNARPVVSLELVDRDAAETLITQNNIDWAEFRVRRTGDATQELVVFLNTQQGSARLGEDYRLDGVNNGSTVRFAPGQGVVNVRLYPIDDDFYEGDETVFFHLIAPPYANPLPDPYEIDLARSSVAMVIHDNDPVTTRLEITAPRDGQHFEAGSVIELRAQIIGPNSAETWTIEFFDGDQSIGTTPPNAPIFWRDAIGGPHVINARATNSAGVRLEATPVNITVGAGPALPVVSIGPVGAKTTEPHPTVLVPAAAFTVSRTGPTDQALNVHLEYDGTATPGRDYRELPRQVTIPTGAQSADLPVLALDDQLVEGPEIVRATLVSPETPTGGYVISVHAAEAMVVIGDDEAGAPEIRLDIVEPEADAQFAVGSTIKISALGVWTQGEVDRPVAFFAGNTFIGQSEVVPTLRPTIPCLPSVHTIFWQSAPPGHHVLTARFERAPNLVVTSPPVHITVGSQPPGPVVRIEATSRIAEEDSSPLGRPPLRGEFTVSRTGPTNQSLSVFAHYSGTATPGVDYPRLPFLVTIPAGTASTRLEVVPNADGVPEGIETVVATLSHCPPETDPPLGIPCVAGFTIDPAQDRATVFIRDDGITAGSLAITNPRDEAAFNLGETILIEATAIDPEGSISRVEFWDGETRIGESEIVFIQPPAPGTPIQHRFEWRGAASGAHVLTARATTANGTALRSPHVHITVGGQTPGPVVRIEATSRIAEEDSSPLDRLPLRGEFTISRTGPTNQSLSVFVHYSGTATPGADYPRLPFLVTIPAGAASTRLEVVPNADRVTEGIETLVATLSHCPPETDPPLGMPCVGGFTIDPAHARASVFIRDDATTGASVTITNPRDGANFDPGETIPIRATAIDPEGFIDLVEFWDGEQKIGMSAIVHIPEIPPGTPSHHSFEWRSASSGPHVLTARAPRPGGTTLVSPPVRITVGPAGNQPPHVTITRPSSGTEFPLDTAIEIVAETRDPDGSVRQVEFFADGRKIGESSTEVVQAPDPGRLQTFTFVWRQPTPGPHALTARATDDDGATSTSATVEIRVGMSEPLPVVTVTAPDPFAVEPRANSDLNTATFRIRRDGPTENALVVAYSLHGTAGNGVDYETLSGLAAIPAGERSVAVVVRPLADNLPERFETVLLRVEQPPAPGPDNRVINPYRVGRPSVAVAVISDELPVLPPGRAECMLLPGNLLHVCFPAEAGRNYRVEASGDLRNWETLFEAVSSDGTWHFIDDIASHRQRFYRLTPEPLAAIDE